MMRKPRALLWILCIVAAGTVMAVAYELCKSRAVGVAHGDASATKDMLETRIAAMLDSSDKGFSPAQRYLFLAYRRGSDHLKSTPEQDLTQPFPISAILGHKNAWPHATLGVEWLESGFSVRGLFVQDKRKKMLADDPHLFQWSDGEKKWFAGTVDRDYMICVVFDGEPLESAEGPWTELPKLKIHTTLTSAMREGLRIGLITSNTSTDTVSVFIDPSVGRHPTTRRK